MPRNNRALTRPQINIPRLNSGISDYFSQFLRQYDEQVLLNEEYKRQEEARQTRIRERREERNVEEFRRKLNRELSKRNSELLRAELEERRKRWEVEKEDRLKEIEKKKKAADEQYEKDFKQWIEDVNNNPDAYSVPTRIVARHAKESMNSSGGFLNDVWHFGDEWAARRHFDILNAVGSLVQSSIDTNGQTIQGNMSLNETRKAVALRYEESLNAQEELDKINDRIRKAEYTSMDLPVDLNQYNKDLYERDRLTLFINSPETKAMSDAYKLFVVLDNKPWLSKFFLAAGNAIELGTTYDKYKQRVAERLHQELLDEYDKIVGTFATPGSSAYLTNFPELWKDELNLKFSLQQQVSKLYLPENNSVAQPAGESFDYQEAIRKNERKIINNLNTRVDADNKVLQKEYELNRTHLRESEEYWNVAKGYKMNIEAHADDAIYNPYYWLYELPPMIGSSTSSPSQAASTVIKGVSTIAGVAAAPFTEGASLNLLWISELAATPLDWQGAVDENYAEVGEKRINNIISLLKDHSITKETGDEDVSVYQLVIEELKARSEAVWRARGWKESWIKEHLDGELGAKNAIADYITGITRDVKINTDSTDKNNTEGQLEFSEFLHPAFQDALLYSTKGLLALFDADMMRTAGEMPFQKAMTIIPTRFWKIGGRVLDRTTSKIGKAISSKIEKDVAGNVSARVSEQAATKGATQSATRKYANGFNRSDRTFREAFKHGYEVGSEAGDMVGFGFVGHTIGGTIGGTIEGTAHAAKKMIGYVNPRLGGLIDGMQDKIMMKYQAVIDKMTPEKLWKQALLKYGIKATGRGIAIGASEAAEEAVQYLNSKEDFAGKYGWGGMSLADWIMGDLRQGGRVLDAYLALAGIGDSPLLDDQEYWQNAKGGFMLGGLPMANPSSMILTVANITHGYREYKTQDAMMSSGVMSREYDSMNRASLSEFAKLAFLNREQYVMSAIDNMLKADSRRENPFFSQEDYDLRRTEAQVVMAMTRNKNIRRMLEAKGIVYGTDEYATAIADLYSLKTNLDDNNQQTRSTRLDLESIYNSQVFNTAVKSIVDDVMLNSPGDKAIIDEYIKDQGDNAVIAEIDAIRTELDLDPGSKKYSRIINSPEYKQRIADARERAELAARTEVEQNMFQTVVAKTRIAHRLQALLEMKARYNTVNSFFSFLKDKFKLNTKRPDAKTIMNSIDKQIKEAKQQLADITGDISNKFDANSTDAATLDYLEQIQDVVHTKELDAQLLEAALALLEADREVTQSYYDLFTEGLVRDEKGEWEYNLGEFNALKEEKDRVLNLLKAGKIDEVKQISEVKRERIKANQEDAKNNTYKRRINAIMEANKRNQALKWAVNEVANGDAVNKLMITLEDERRVELEKAKKQQTEQQKVDQSSRDPFDSYEQQLQKTEEKPQSPGIKEKYAERREKVKKFFNRAKNKYDKFSKSTAKAVPIPFFDQIVKGAYMLAENASLGALKFGEFVEQIKDMLPGVSLNDALSSIKAGYNKRRAYYLMNNPSVLDNMSTAEEVMAYTIGESNPITITPPPAQLPLHTRMQQRFDEDSTKIIDNVSSHYDLFVEDEDGVHIYVNESSLLFAGDMISKANVDRIADILIAANTSDDAFRNAIKSIPGISKDFPVDEYVKYRDVDGVELAIARKYLSWVRPILVENGIKVRDAVIAILLDNSDLININEYPDGINQFIHDILNLKALLEGLGLTILNTKLRIYGKNEEGKRISVEADIIAADESGKVYAIDVRSGWNSLRSRWNKVVYKTGTTVKNLEVELLKSVELIINDKFLIQVKSLRVLPIVYNTQVMYVEKADDNTMTISIKTMVDRNYSNKVGQLKNDAESFVNDINDRILEYNSIVSEARKYTDEYCELLEITAQLYNTTQDYITYLEQLHVQFDDLLSRIEEMKLKILDNIDRENNLWLENIEHTSETEGMSDDLTADVARLEDCCKRLDIALQYIPQVKATTEQEKDKVKVLYLCIFDALRALDDVLQHPDSSRVNLSPEIELITTAIDILVENKENFGGMSVFMRRWWADNFVFGVGDNTQISVTGRGWQTSGFVDQIRAWIDVLENHVLNDIDGRFALQEWYSSILNRYFSKLLDNAEQYANQMDATTKNAIDVFIKRGRALIDKFNELYGTLPDEDFLGPPVDLIERINRMPVKWHDLYGDTTAHYPGFDSMANSVIYYVMSTSLTFTRGYRTQSSPIENPEDKSTRFTLFEDRSGQVKLRINWWDGGKWTFAELPFQTDISKYRNPSDEDIARFLHVNTINKKFERKVKAMLDYIKEHPEYTITFTVKPNKGSIRYGGIDDHHNVSEFLFKNSENQHDLYTISLSEQDRIGIGVFITDRATGEKFYDIKAGQNLKTRIGGFDDTYNKQKLNTPSGAVVYFYDTGEGNYIGVPLKTTQIKDDSVKLVDLIYKYVTGNQLEDGYDIMSLLHLRLYIYDPNRRFSEYNNINSLVTINKNGDVVIGNSKYNVFTERNKLIDAISKLDNSTDAALLNENMMSSSDPVMTTLRQRFLTNPGLLLITLPNGFTINREDFTHQNNNGTQGSTWLGYLLRNSILGTRATSKGYKQVNIDNVRLVSKNAPLDVTQTNNAEHRSEIRRRRPSALSTIDDPFANAKGGLAMTVDKDDIDATRGTEEQEGFVQAVKEYFEKVFGTSEDVVFDDILNKYIIPASRNQYVIGLTTSTMVKLSRYAPYEAMFHEAFHKLMELVLEPKTRDEFYKIYRDHNNGPLTDRQIAEGLADMFVDYMTAKTLPKDARWYHKIFKWFKVAACALGMCWKYGIRNTRKMYTVYQNMNAGYYAKNSKVYEENKKRFVEQFDDELYYKVNGKEFEHIADSGQLQEMVKALGYYILESYGIDQIDPDVHFTIDLYTPNMIPSNIMESLIAEGIPDNLLTAVDLAFREVLKKGKKIPIIAEKGKNKGKTVGYKYEYPNFAAIAKNVSDYIESILGAYSGKIEETQEEDFGENQDVQNMNIDKFDRASYEFSKLDSQNRKIKLFFATIPYCTFDEDGKIVIDYSKNEFECPEFAPIEEVYNVIVNDLHTVLDIDELDAALRKLAEYSPMHRAVWSKYHNLISGIYTTLENGETKIDYEREAFAIQILNAIRSLKIDFVIALSKTDKRTKNKQIRIASSSLERDARQFPKQWTQYLIAGQVGVFSTNRDKNGNFIFREGMGGENGQDIFSRTASFINEIRRALSQSNDVFVIDGKEYHKDSLENISKLKIDLVQKLRTIGIMFQVEALDHMLLTQYGDMGATGLLSWITHSGTSSINTFLDTLNKFVNDNGTINKDVVENGYKKNGFVADLAKWLGAYNRIHTQQMALGLNKKRLYSISLNSSISHIINMLNTQNLDNETIRTLMKFGFNITDDDFAQGSIILKAIKLRKDQHITGHTYIGFKTDNRGDEGSEYTKEATVDDYMAKLTMLQLGYMIFPTLSDKGTWMILDGVEIPGMSFQKAVRSDANGRAEEYTVVKDSPTILFINGKPYIIPCDKMLNQMLEYANTERLAIQQCMEDLGYTYIPGYQKQGRRKLKQNELIKNYHTPNRDKKGNVVEPNGTRFLSLTKIVCKELVDGKVVLKTYNLNDPNISSVELLSLANQHFFNKSIEEQKEIMALTLAIQAMNEIDTAIDLGLVKREDKKGEWKNKQGREINANVSKDERSIMNLNSIYLNEDLISALTFDILNKIEHKDYKTWAAIPQETADLVAEKSFKGQIARSMAIAAILADSTYRSIICSQEVMRCFSGHPATFKVNYDFKKSQIKDSAFDIQKRIGGMISTGEDNVIGLPGIPPTYTCAECADYNVSSASDVASRLDDLFLIGEVRDAIASSLHEFQIKDPVGFAEWTREHEIESDNPYDIIYSKSIEEIEKITPMSMASVLLKAEENAKKFSSSYKKGINVADGAAYITDLMCENMLRMRGAYTRDVLRAFEILRSDNTKYSWADKRDAYDKIYKATNLVTTKYTAYGFRNHVTNGEESSDVAVAYYNKFALFPLFHCTATGKMSDIYQKMLDEKVDMLMMDSAVKVGSLGAVEFDGNSIKEPFTKYTQSYAYLRRLLNTDPEEGDRSTMGTLMVKIGLQNLRLRRNNYVHARSGKNVSGEELLNSFMGSIKQLALIGAYELNNMFFKEGTEEIDPEKLSNYLKDLLSTRNANKALIEAIQVTTDPITGQKKLVCPLAATPDARWIESILISTINKKIIDITTPGSSFVQRSVFAMEGKAEPGEGVIASDANMSPEINGGKKLQMINEDGSMDAVVSMDFFDDIIFKGKMRNMSFNEKRQWLIDNNIIGPNAKANTIGYRIPTQALSSIHAFRFVDVVQAVKSTIILPEEFTKITGSDFDIDHIYMTAYNYNVSISEDGVQYATTTFNPVEDDGKYQRQYHENNIIDCLMTLLKDVENSTNCLYKSIDNDTELIQNPANLIEEYGSTKSDPYNFGTLHEQVIRKNDYLTGKSGIGPFALNVTNLVLTQLYGVRFNSTKFTNATGIRSLDHIYDYDGNAISSWLSAFINAHVDIVKDPYISKLNVNQYTYNMINLLIRSGFGELAVWFVALPIIRDMSFANELAKSQYARDPQKTKSTYAAQEYAVMQAVLKYMSKEECSSAVVNKYAYSSDGRDIDVRINTIKWIKEHKDVLAEIAKHPDAKEVTVDGIKYNTADVQKTVFYAWKTLEKYAIALSNLVQHTKIDTRKHGKSLIAILQYLDAYNKLFGARQSESIWDMSSLHRLENNSWIGMKTRMAISAPTTILNHLTFAANPNFIRALIRYGNILSTTGGALNTETLEFISRCLITAIKSEYIVKYAREKLGKTDEQISALFIGPRSMSKRLVMLKNAIETNPKYARLKNNHLINLIYSETEEDPYYASRKQGASTVSLLIVSPGFITVLDNVDDSMLNSNLLIDGWEDLLNDEDKFVRLFARDLIVYSFLTSGEFKGWHKLFKYVPPAWIRGEIDTDIESFALFIEKKLNEDSNDYRGYLEEIVSNNFMDYRLSRKVPLVNEDKTYNFVDVNGIIKIGKAISDEQATECEQYITVKDDVYSGKGVIGYNLYKLIGFIPSRSGLHPIYARIKKKGYHDNSGHDIYEYGWKLRYAENENDTFVDFDSSAAIARVEAVLNEQDEGFSSEETSARAIANVYLGITDDVVVEKLDRITLLMSSINSISEKTEAFGVEISNGSEDFWNKIRGGWQTNHPNGLVAYRKNGDKPESFTPETVKRGWIGNPFSTYERGLKTVQNFYDWIITGINPDPQKYPYATEKFRQAIIDKILTTPENSPILYYTELNRPSHATVIGYLINNKGLLTGLGPEATSTTKKQNTVEPGAHNHVDVVLLNNPEMGEATAQGTIDSMNSNDNPEFTRGDNVLKKRLGGSPLKVAMASEHTDPAFHSREVCRKINEDLARPRGLRKYHMLQIMTKHDGLLLLDMLELNIPKSVHFSITSLGGTQYEPGVMKTDDLLDRIEQLINDGKLNPSTTTIRIDPIIPGVTIPNNIAHIMDRASRMGIRSIKISVMDSYGYDEQSKERGVMENMTRLGYDFDKYYRKYQATQTTYDRWGNIKQKEGEWYWTQDANSDMMLKIYQKVDELAQKYNVYCTTCGEKPNTSYKFKRLAFSSGCLNATGVASVLGVSKEDVETEAQIGNQRPGKCNCLNCKSDVLAYDDTCASQCAYCYAKHGSKTAMQYYDKDGKLLDNDFTRTSRKNVSTKIELSEIKQTPIWKLLKTIISEDLYRGGSGYYTHELLRFIMNPSLFSMEDNMKTLEESRKQDEETMSTVKLAGIAGSTFASEMTRTVGIRASQAMLQRNAYDTATQLLNLAKSSDDVLRSISDYIDDILNGYEYLKDHKSLKNTIAYDLNKAIDALLKANNDSQNNQLPGPETKINIYAGTGENADLSNFAERPFTIKNSRANLVAGEIEYFSVEQAFQLAKFTFVGRVTNDGWQPHVLQSGKLISKEDNEFNSRLYNAILNSKNSAEIKILGSKFKHLDRGKWDVNSSNIMKSLIKASFEQNPQALQRLLATGNATLTHTQDKGKWGTEFPRILMEVRDELRKEQQGTTSDNRQQEIDFNDENEFPTDEMNHCKR